MLLLVYAVFHWGFSSPLEIEVITGSQGRVEPASPDQVDALLQKAAVDIENKSMIDRARPPSPVPDYAGQLARLQSPSVPPVQIVISPPHPPEGTITNGEPVAKAGLKEIEAIIPKPGKPLVMVDREFTQKDPEPVDVLASHVVATFRWGELVKRLEKSLTQTAIFPEVVVVRVEAQIRERRLDGDWGPARVVTMTRIPDRDGAEIAIPTVPAFDGDNLDEVNGAIRDLAEQWQESILQPDYWDIWWTTQEWNTWLIHLPSNPISEKIEKEREAEEEAEKAADRAAERAAARAAPRRTRRTTRRDRRTTRGRGGEDAEYAAMARQAAEEEQRFAEEMERRARGEERGRGRRDTRRGSYRDRRTTRRGGARAPTDVSAPKVTEITTLQEQLEDGLLLFWFHHTELEGLKEYQYRVRLVFVNPLITYSRDVKNDDDAKQPVVASPWSDWSAPFSAPQMTEFFAVSPMGSRRAVRVEVFTRGRGQWVMKGFLVAEGEMIGGEGSVRVPNPDDGTLESKTMDFSTGAVAVRLDFSKTVRRRKISVKTVEMVYMDAKGRLKTRVAAADKNSQRYKQLKEEVSRARAAADAAVGYGR